MMMIMMMIWQPPFSPIVYIVSLLFFQVNCFIQPSAFGAVLDL